MKIATITSLCCQKTIFTTTLSLCLTLTGWMDGGINFDLIELYCTPSRLGMDAIDDRSAMPARWRVAARLFEMVLL